MNLEKWMKTYCLRIKAAFGSRVCFIGLQGSRARSEAREGSDIDVVCILDQLLPADILRYREALDGIECRELVCGFLSGWNELLHWEPSELLQFYYDTVPYTGDLDRLLECLDDEAAARAVRIGAGAIYHGCVHNMVHGRNAQALIELYKAAGFVLRAEYFRRNRRYVRSSDELMNLLPERDRLIIHTSISLRKGADVDFDTMSEELFLWAQRLLA